MAGGGRFYPAEAMYALLETSPEVVLCWHFYRSLDLLWTLRLAQRCPERSLTRALSPGATHHSGHYPGSYCRAAVPMRAVYNV